MDRQLELAQMAVGFVAAEFRGDDEGRIELLKSMMEGKRLQDVVDGFRTASHGALLTLSDEMGQPIPEVERLVAKRMAWIAGRRTATSWSELDWANAESAIGFVGADAAQDDARMRRLGPTIMAMGPQLVTALQIVLWALIQEIAELRHEDPAASAALVAGNFAETRIRAAEAQGGPEPA